MIQTRKTIVNKVIIWKQFRLPILALTFSMTFLVLGKILLLKPEKVTVSSSIFSEQVPLPKWQFKKNGSLPNPKKIHLELITQKHYEYTRNNLPLDLEMRYVTEGNVPMLIKEFTSITSSTTVRQQKGIGYYGVGIDQKRAYLSACINPYGNSTFTEEQFNQNRFHYEIQPQHLLSWLLGQKQLQHKRCLWTHLSIPLNNSSPEAAYQVLENVWFSWYQWWQPRFSYDLNK
ncbi:cyanoexosortase A system-associated protein [Scytonema sp. NUACC26]|uniref:cyanoexosortase A system-associated protein n=1 Tax=Scytonema sp. NUACC26 TaxID=3140176 RepID=UPI0034DBEA11